MSDTELVKNMANHDADYEQSKQAAEMMRRHYQQDNKDMVKIHHKHYEVLLKLAKAAGRYVNSESRTDYQERAWERLNDAHIEWCEIRHDLTRH